MTSKSFPCSSAGKKSSCKETLVQLLDREVTPEKGYASHSSIFGVSLVAQMVKNPPAMWETSVRSLGWEDPLEKGMVTHSSILA